MIFIAMMIWFTYQLTMIINSLWNIVLSFKAQDKETKEELLFRGLTLSGLTVIIIILTN